VISTLAVTLRAGLLVAALALVPLPAAAAETAATALGEVLPAAELERAGDGPARVARLRDWIWERVYRHFVAEQGLSATAADIDELRAYHREFERRDRLQRARKLAELDRRLAADDLGGDERAWLTEFRDILARMAERDARSERAPEEEDEEERGALYAPWVEFPRANRALYDQYGGVVVVTSAGPAAYGARLALIEDYERRGLVEFPDARLREALFALMSRAPARTIPPDQVDFTPYWKQPIPPSYFPE